MIYVYIYVSGKLFRKKGVSYNKLVGYVGGYWFNISFVDIFIY